MKQFLGTITIIISSFLPSCGYQQAFRDNCRLEGQTCDTLFGVNQVEVDETQDARLAQHDKEILSISTQINGLVADLKKVETDMTQNAVVLVMLQNLINLNQGDINLIQVTLDSMQLDQDALEEKIAYQQTLITSMQSDLTLLEQQDSIVEAILPCGDRPNKFDETLLRMKSGKLIAYFESGGNRFLTILTPGIYRTTDSAPYCYFNVNSELQITGAHR